MIFICYIEASLLDIFRLLLIYSNFLVINHLL